MACTGLSFLQGIEQGWCLHCRYTPAWRPGQLDEVDEADLEELLEQMKFALEMADRNARLIHPTPWQEAQVFVLSLPHSSAETLPKM